MCYPFLLSLVVQWARQLYLGKYYGDLLSALATAKPYNRDGDYPYLLRVVATPSFVDAM